MKKIFRLSLLALLLLSSVFAFLYWKYQPEVPHNVQLENGAELHWTPCWFSVPWDWQRYPLCAHFYPSDAGLVAKRERIKLPVVILRQWPWAYKSNKPILYLSGGPGASSALHELGIMYWQIFLDDAAWQGDWVVFDQRGTGAGTPKLICPDLSTRIREILSKALPLQEEFRQFNAAYAECYEYWLKQGVDLSAYNTQRNAQDAAELMQALNQELSVKHWNLFGVSYGTRLALQIMREHETLLHSVILDSVYPPEHHALAEVPFIVNQALEVLFTGCAQEALCNWAYPELEARFYTLLEQIEQKPLSFEMFDPETGIPIPVEITASRLLDIIFIALYRWDLIEQLPMLIYQAADGHAQALEPLVRAYLEALLDNDVSDAMNMSVECYDMGDGLDAHSYQQQVALYPRIRHFVEDFWAYSPCHFWQNQRASADFLQPVKSSVPTLLLSGRFDPITPPQWAKQAAASLLHSHIIEFPDMGHAVIDGTQCATDVASIFLQNPRKTPEHACLDNLAYPNFVLQETH